MFVDLKIDCSNTSSGVIELDTIAHSTMEWTLNKFLICDVSSKPLTTPTANKRMQEM